MEKNYNFYSLLVLLKYENLLFFMLFYPQTILVPSKF